MHVWVEGLRQGLQELGLEEGKQLVLDIRETNYDLKAVEAAARDLERAHVDPLYTVTTSVTTAAKRATVRVPIVSSDRCAPSRSCVEGCRRSNRARWTLTSRPRTRS